MYRKDMKYEGVEWIQLGHNTIGFRLVKTMMKLRGVSYPVDRLSVLDLRFSL
jgi:hypothetical protein